MVPRMTRGLPVLVMRGMLWVVVVVKHLSGGVGINGFGCERTGRTDWDKSLLNIYIFVEGGDNGGSVSLCFFLGKSSSDSLGDAIQIGHVHYIRNRGIWSTPPGIFRRL
jgi:hypothetical protein